MQKLRPSEYRKSIFGIDLDRLKQKGMKAIIMDLDNTLVKWNAPEPTEALIGWLDRVHAMGFKTCIVSNNTGGRVGEFARRVGIPFVSGAIKPRRKGFRRAMEQMGVKPEETAVVGDQIFTDVFGGNRAGAYTILVVPIDKREHFGTRFVRMVERKVLDYLHRNGLLLED